MLAAQASPPVPDFESALPQDQAAFQRLLEVGCQSGINLQYVVQPKPDGLAQAFLIGEEFIGTDSVCLVLGDNIFYGQGFRPILQEAASQISGATIFGYPVKDPQRFGVVEFDDQRKAVSIEEKPQHPKSNFAITGLYFYDNDMIEIAKSIWPSSLGELEITSINQDYMNQRKLRVQQLGRGFAWLDTGTNETLLQAAQFVETIESRQGYKIACPEEIAFRQGWLSSEQLVEIASQYVSGSYGQYIRSLIKS